MSHWDVHFCRLLKINILLSFRITDNCHFLVCFRVEVFRQNVEQQIFYCHFLNVFLHVPLFLNIGVNLVKHFTFNQEQRSSAFTSITFVRPCQPTIFFILDQKMFLRLASIQCFPRWAFPSNKSKKESKKWKIWKDQTKEEKDWDGLDSFFSNQLLFISRKYFFLTFVRLMKFHLCSS